MHIPSFHPTYRSTFAPSPVHYDFDETPLVENEHDSKLDYRNVWDPWDEYENIVDNPPEHVEPLLPPPHNSDHSRTESITENISGPFESHNTNAHYVEIPHFPSQDSYFTPSKSPPHYVQPEIHSHAPVPHYVQPEIHSPVPVPYYVQPEIHSHIPVPHYVHPEIHSHAPVPHHVQSEVHSRSPPYTNSLQRQYVETENVQLSRLDAVTHEPRNDHFSHTNNSPAAIPDVPAIENNPYVQTPALPQEFEPSCTVASESTLHLKDSGPNDSNKDVSMLLFCQQLALYI